MTTATREAPYTLRHIEEMLGLGRSAVSSLIGAGFVTPTRGTRNEYRFTFQDVVLLRTAHQLRAANVPARRLLRSLKELKSRLPEEVPLSGLRITSVGGDVAVREGGSQWQAETGQLLIDFEVADAGGTVSFLQRTPAAAGSIAGSTADRTEPTAAQWYSLGEQLEAGDPAAAERAYRRALALAPGHEYAYVNLGAMLCESGRCAEAVALYDHAIGNCPDAPLLHFNRAIALEDQGRDRDALQSYERCLALAPELADAHFNAARLHERLGHSQRALRHYSAYRRLQEGQPTATP